MQITSHQTVRLSKGRHRSPTHGMCVMELASVLAGERFSDYPEAVCPVIGSLLRAYNDRLDQDRRQALIPYAAQVVGTRAGHETARLRAERCVEFARAVRDALPRWRWLRRHSFTALLDADGIGHANCGALVIESIGRPNDEAHRAVLRLVDELIAIDARRPKAPVAEVRPSTPSNA
jgi:hypothetical protein